MQALVLPTVGEDAIGSDHNGYGGWHKGQKWNPGTQDKMNAVIERNLQEEPDESRRR